MGSVKSLGEINAERSESEVSIESIDHRIKESMVYRPIDSIDYSEVAKNDNSYKSQYRQRAIAMKLLDTFKEPRSWKFYLKCAYSLSEATIWEIVELAMAPKIKKHNNYFVKLANKEMSGKPYASFE